jgi:molecular chaperone DnaK
LANRAVAPFIRKGDKLPARASHDHYTTELLRAGHEEDIVRIPLLEGEHARAARNHLIGDMEIRGTHIERDLPLGSLLEITLLQDASQQLKMKVYSEFLDREFFIEFDPSSKRESLDELEQEWGIQRARMEEVRRTASEAGAKDAEAIVNLIERQELPGQIEGLIRAAVGEPEAVNELDRLLRELAAHIDDAEDAAGWPLLLAEVQEALEWAEKAVAQHGDASDRNRLSASREAMERAVDVRDSDLLTRCKEDLDSLYYRVVSQQPRYHVARFDWLVERMASMKDPGQAEKIVAQGRRARQQDDLEALKAANRQLVSLLPRPLRREERHANVGDTISER